MNRREVLRFGLLAGAQALVSPLLAPGPRRLLADPVESPRPLRGFQLPRTPDTPDTPEGIAVSDRAAEIVHRTTVIDMLSLLTLDWPRLYGWESQPQSFGKADLARLRASGIGVFHPAVDPSEADAHGAARRWMAGWNRLIDGHCDTLLRIDCAADLERVKAADRIGLLLGFQNSNHFRTAADVELFHDLGQRVSQLTYNERNRIGSGCTDPDAGGLSQFGATIVAAMNRAGMAIDISHCGERTCLDALEASAAPVLITHSNCRALVHHPRCKSDAVIRAMAQKGGVIGISVLPMMVSGSRPATLDAILDHFDHAARLVGVEHVGLGSDTDVDAIDPRTRRVRAAYRVRGMRHEYRVFEIAEGLLRRGYGADDIAGILGGNFQRALTRIWSA
ncbi:MAG TPA: membrane dipeptidase [Thermoanaerobaculia bacterium]|nr:membrane dipeptidase [Thermoanaerobaculia bacterium]